MVRQTKETTDKCIFYPNYQKDNISNLMSSILQAIHIPTSSPTLVQLPPQKLQQAQNIILFIVDGLGYDHIEQLDKKNILHTHCIGPLHTVFPSTTAAAITTFLTGKTPLEHGNIAWYIYAQEYKKVICALPFKTRTHKPLSKNPGLLLPKSIFQQTPLETYMILHQKLLKSHYNSLLHGNEQQFSFKSISSLPNLLEKTITQNKNKKYIYCYWDKIDEYSHHYGKKHPKVKHQLQILEQTIQTITKKIKQTNTILIITADHGQIITTPKKTLVLKDHPLLQECLSEPLAGEARAAFCHIKPNKRQQFEQYVKHKLQKYCTIHPSTSLQHLFGTGTPHHHINTRYADYILLMKENYVFREFLKEDKLEFIPGHHGGLSKEEMLVPLIVFDLKYIKPTG